MKWIRKSTSARKEQARPRPSWVAKIRSDGKCTHHIVWNPIFTLVCHGIDESSPQSTVLFPSIPTLLLSCTPVSPKKPLIIISADQKLCRHISPPPHSPTIWWRLQPSQKQTYLLFFYSVSKFSCITPIRPTYLSPHNFPITVLTKRLLYIQPV